MNDDELLSFNQIISEAFSKYVHKDNADLMKMIVAAAIRTGAPPETIYATVKTGRLLTTQNMKLLPKEEIKEWFDAVDEYLVLASCSDRKP